MTDPTIQGHTPASGEVLIGPDGQPIPESKAGTNVPDPLMNDIDAMFGNTGTASGDGKPPEGTPGIDEDGLPIAPVTGNKQPEVNSFDGMTPDQQAKHFQSLHNKLENEYNLMKPEYEKYKSVADFVNQVYEDPQVKAAFLAELAPDLVKPTDPYDALQEQLGKEFGEDFVPDETETQTPLSKSWRYHKRVEELYKASADKAANSTPTSLKELRKSREQALKDADAVNATERSQIMSDMKWGQVDWDEFSQWGGKLKTKHLSRYFEAGRKNRGGKAPNLVNQGGGAQVGQPAAFENLTNFFG
jgi:hypothetical protein